MDENFIKEKDDMFIHVCFQSIKKTLAKTIVPLIAFCLYIGIRLFVRGDADTGWLTYIQLIWISGVSALVIYIHTFTIIYHLSDINEKRIGITLKRIIFSMVEGLTSFAMYLIILIYAYCIIIVGLKSLLDFQYGLSVFPIIKIILFSIYGIVGLVNIIHMIKIEKLLTVKGDISNEYIRFALQDRAMQYIIKNDLLDKKDKKED